MLNQYLFFVISALVIYLAECAPPPSLKICKTEDSKCIKEAAKLLIPLFAEGMPEYGVEVMDPLQIKSVNASEGNLLFLLNDITVKGLKNCEVKKIYYDKAKAIISLVLQCTASLDGTYIMKGSILLVPVEGDGKIHVDLDSALFYIDFDTVVKTGADGKKHWSIKSVQHTFDLKEKSHLEFENLNNGNEIIGRAAKELIANNGNDVVKAIGHPAIKAVVNRIAKNVNHFFKAIPTEELSLDTE